MEFPTLMYIYILYLIQSVCNVIFTMGLAPNEESN